MQAVVFFIRVYRRDKPSLSIDKPKLSIYEPGISTIIYILWNKAHICTLKSKLLTNNMILLKNLVERYLWHLQISRR